MVARGTPKDDENQKDMKEDQPEGEEVNLFTYWPSRAKTLNLRTRQKGGAGPR